MENKNYQYCIQGQNYLNLGMYQITNSLTAAGMARNSFKEGNPEVLPLDSQYLPMVSYHLSETKSNMYHLSPKYPSIYRGR